MGRGCSARLWPQGPGRASRCLSEPGTLVSVVSSLLFDKSVLNKDPATGPLGARLEENTPTGPIDVPLLVAQGEIDNLILPTMQAEYVQQRCDRGGDVDYGRRAARSRNVAGVQSDRARLGPSTTWSVVVLSVLWIRTTLRWVRRSRDPSGHRRVAYRA
jgi:hypothetical protein